MAIGWAMLFRIAPGAEPGAYALPLLKMADAGMQINAVLMVLNLLPLPPLDGGRIAVSLLPAGSPGKFARLEPYGFPILLVLLFTGVLGDILWPLMAGFRFCSPIVFGLLIPMYAERVLSGMRPTGRLHLGHYHGVLKNWVKLQAEYPCLFFVADWHALTTDYDNPRGSSRTSVWEMLVDWLAAGVDPAQATIFIQSRVPEHAELHLLLSMMTPLGLARARADLQGPAGEAEGTRICPPTAFWAIRC
jgi:hypothetical protein